MDTDYNSKDYDERLFCAYEAIKASAKFNDVVNRSALVVSRYNKACKEQTDLDDDTLVHTCSILEDLDIDISREELLDLNGETLFEIFETMYIYTSNLKHE